LRGRRRYDARMWWRIAWLLDEALDRVPKYEDGRWYRFGLWGCGTWLNRYWTARIPIDQVDNS
jgi:hypothetical protein